MFDAVLMNPPFVQGADIAHIKHALTMLKPGGRLVALCANGPRQNASLRPMVEARGGEWEELPADTFKEEGTGVRVAACAVASVTPYEASRSATGTGHATNLFVAGTLTWDAGEALVRQFKVPEAQRFTNAFCCECGGRVPRSAAGSGMVMIPMGSLDDDPGIEPQARIFQNSRAVWSCSGQSLPGFDTMPG